MSIHACGKKTPHSLRQVRCSLRSQLYKSVGSTAARFARSSTRALLVSSWDYVEIKQVEHSVHLCAVSFRRIHHPASAALQPCHGVGAPCSRSAPHYYTPGGHACTCPPGVSVLHHWRHRRSHARLTCLIGAAPLLTLTLRRAPANGRCYRLIWPLRGLPGVYAAWAAPAARSGQAMALSVACVRLGRTFHGVIPSFVSAHTLGV